MVAAGVRPPCRARTCWHYDWINMSKVEMALRLINAAERVIENEVEWAFVHVPFTVGVGYATNPYGYDDDQVWVAGDWNDTKGRGSSEGRSSNAPSRLAEALERIGIEVEWHDENDSCIECLRLIRTAPDSYRYRPQYVYSDGGHVCMDCVHRDVEGYLNETGAIWRISDGRIDMPVDQTHNGMFGVDELHPLGFVNVKDHIQAGLHPGMDATPEGAAKLIASEYPDCELVFSLDEASQFYGEFSAWVRVKDEDDE